MKNVILFFFRRSLLVKRTIVAFIFLVMISDVVGQSEYSNLIKKADRFYRTKNYTNSALTYSLAFKVKGWKRETKDAYNAACSWALAGVPDSAFYQLNFIVNNKNYWDLGQIVAEHDFNSLKKDKRWKKLLESIELNIKRKEAKLNKQLIQQLDSVFARDQKYRVKKKGEEIFGLDSNEMNQLRKSIKENDSINLIKVKSIIDSFGWLGKDVIGVKGNETLFLVIQHSDPKTQEKYLPIMREAVRIGQAEASSLALLEDRVAISQGKKQIYGSQIEQDPKTGKFIILPIEDEANVNKRRKEVGLDPLEDYVKGWGISYTSTVSEVTNIKKFLNNDFETALEMNDSIIGPVNVSKGNVPQFFYKFRDSDKIAKQNSAIFKIKINHDTLLTFDIVPEDRTDDYDFAIFKCSDADCIKKLRATKIKPERYCLSVNDAKNGSTGLSEYEKIKYVGPGVGKGYASALWVKAGETYYLAVEYGEEYFKTYHKPFPKGFTIYFYNYWPHKKKPIVIENIIFETNKAVLSGKSFVSLDNLAKKLLEDKLMKIEIIGHTDNKGEGIMNQELSEERAKAVFNYLISKNIPSQRLSYRGLGSSKPIASNETEAGRKKNRRVEFVVIH